MVSFSRRLVYSYISVVLMHQKWDQIIYIYTSLSNLTPKLAATLASYSSAMANSRA